VGALGVSRSYKGVQSYNRGYNAPLKEHRTLLPDGAIRPAKHVVYVYAYILPS